MQTNQSFQILGDSLKYTILLLATALMVIPTEALCADGGWSDAGWPDGGEGSIDAGAESDAGDAANDLADGGEPCSASCDGEILTYCDSVTGDAYSLDCSDMEARCGLLSEEWGMDCLLGEDAPCSALYAQANSRCDPAVPLYCNAGTCQRSPGTGNESPDAPTSAGGIDDVGDEDPHPLACLGCDDSDMPDIPLSMLFIGLSVGRLRRGRRRS
jgi:hypothetical protein